MDIQIETSGVNVFRERVLSGLSVGSHIVIRLYGNERLRNSMVSDHALDSQDRLSKCSGAYLVAKTETGAHKWTSEQTCD